MIFNLLGLYALGLIFAVGVHGLAVSSAMEDTSKKPPVRTRWLWTFLTIFWPIGIAYFVCKYLFWE